jgi:hypothetical protein
MYGQELQKLRDDVEDLREDLKEQKRILWRFINAQILCAMIIAISAVANGFDVLPNGGNGGIIAVCVIAWIVLLVGMFFYCDEKYDVDLPSKLRTQERDLRRREAVAADAANRP